MGHLPRTAPTSANSLSDRAPMPTISLLAEATRTNPGQSCRHVWVSLSNAPHITKPSLNLWSAAAKAPHAYDSYRLKPSPASSSLRTEVIEVACAPFRQLVPKPTASASPHVLPLAEDPYRALPSYHSSIDPSSYSGQPTSPVKPYFSQLSLSPTDLLCQPSSS